ncbi:hypothetical protein ACJX0J_005782, partial [Zea mays]
VSMGYATWMVSSLILTHFSLQAINIEGLALDKSRYTCSFLWLNCGRSIVVLGIGILISIMFQRMMMLQ